MSTEDVRVDYLSTGANRQTAVADWSISGVLAFGADNNVALWRPNVRIYTPRMTKIVVGITEFANFK